jgi:2-phosphosulfolactate phosphatase
VVSVALTPAGLRAAPTIVAVDVLRATSTITQALAAGYARVLCFDSHERALANARAGRVLAGERACLPPPGFDEGNSPAAFSRRRGDDVGLATTNGTPLIVRASGVASRVVVASLLNLDAVVAAVQGADVLVACAGNDGEPAVEDVFVAGLLVERLGSPAGDAAELAMVVARSLGNPGTALQRGRGAANLRRAGLGADIEYCARTSVVDCVPEATAERPGVAVAELRGAPSA